MENSLVFNVFGDMVVRLCRIKCTDIPIPSCTHEYTPSSFIYSLVARQQKFISIFIHLLYGGFSSHVGVPEGITWDATFDIHRSGREREMANIQRLAAEKAQHQGFPKLPPSRRGFVGEVLMSCFFKTTSL